MSQNVFSSRGLAGSAMAQLPVEQSSMLLSWVVSFMAVVNYFSVM